MSDAVAAVGMLVQLGRAVPSEKWVDAMIEGAEQASLEEMF